MRSHNKLICIGAVTVIAEQQEPTITNPFMLQLYTTEAVLTELGEEAVKTVGFEFVASSKWANRFMAMKDGDKALLPSQHGFYCVVHRYDNEAVLGIFDFIPIYSLDWSDVSQSQDSPIAL